MNSLSKQAWIRTLTWPKDNTEVKRAFGSAEAVVWHSIHKWSPKKGSGG